MSTQGTRAADVERAEIVESELTELMDSDEFAHLFRERGDLDLDLDWGPDWGLDGAFAGYFFWGLLVVAAVAIVVAILRRVGILAPRKAKVQEADTGEHRRRRVTEALEAGAAARADGDLRLALRHYWSALVTGLGRGEAVAWRPAWTCREMLARSRPGTSAVRLLAELLPDVERLEFGRDTVTPADVDRLASLCDEHLTAVLRREELGS